LLDAYAPFLSQPFVDAHFELYQKQLAGIPVQRPRWKRAVNAIAGQGAGDFGALGEAVGELYVQRHFKPEAKKKMEELVDNLLAAFGDSIDDLTWMTDETKVRAKEKLSKIGTKIGYPDVWRDYSKLEVKPDDLFGNVYRSNLVEHARNIGHLGQPIDRNEWGMTPQTVNAYYTPTKNEIVFPAAILQPPFFSMNAPDGLNYGGIGAVIGHEISHAFDDQGSRYDGDGNLKNWWSEDDEKAFKELTRQLIDQYASYQPLDGKNVNGQLTLGENIADLSGLSIAHKALTIAREGKPEEIVAGWNSDQLFFVGWSRVWQRKYREKEMIKRLLTDPHSPSQFRANGPVNNIDAFYKAFDLKPGDGLYKPEDERIKIW
jgi:predicted metalloendopeptidase